MGAVIPFSFLALKSSGPPVSGAVLWLRPEELVAGAITSWPSPAGTGLPSPTGTATATTSQINGKTGAVFDGASNILSTSPPVTTSLNFSIFVVVKPASTGNGCIVSNGHITTNGYGVYIDSSTRKGFLGGVANLSDGSATTDSEIWTLQQSGSTSTFLVDGVVQSISGSGTPVAPGSETTIGDFGDIGGYLFNGAICEILLYDTSISGRTTVQSYLGAKYAIPLGQPQISLIDFNSLNGGEFVTGDAGLSFNFYAAVGNAYTPWYNTGGETNPAPGGGGTTIEVDISPSPFSTGADIALATVNAINAAVSSLFTAVQVDGGGTGTACQITTKPIAGVYGSTPDVVTVNTPAAFSTPQTGVGNS